MIKAETEITPEFYRALCKDIWETDELPNEPSGRFISMQKLEGNQITVPNQQTFQQNINESYEPNSENQNLESFKQALEKATHAQIGPPAVRLSVVQNPGT